MQLSIINCSSIGSTKLLITSLCTILFWSETVLATNEDPNITFEDLFQAGKNAYTAKDWDDCVGFMRRAMEDYAYYNDEVMWCREKCGQQIQPELEMGISHTYSVAQSALCLLRCKHERLTAQRPPLKKHLIWYDMEERLPYRYMHICYWNKGDLDHAVKAAYTYLVRHPEHEETLENLKFYMKQDEYTDNMMVDLMRREYENAYITGVTAYEEEEWTLCVDQLELSLEKVLHEDRVCRLDCQDKIDWSSVEGTLEIDVIETSMRTSVLRCESNCLNRLAWINGHNVGNIIASHFEYLHICQFNLMRGTDAAQSVANYLLFDDSPAMRRNKHVYMKKYKRNELFTPSQAMLALHRKLTLEKRLLEFIDARFKFGADKELPTEMASDRQKMDTQVEISDNFPYDRIETFLSKEECKTLRSTFHTTTTKALEDELSVRLSTLIDHEVTVESIQCMPDVRHPRCSRSLVLSLEETDCSAWLSPYHNGCSIVFCA